jgi:hypothetical protein
MATPARDESALDVDRETCLARLRFETRLEFLLGSPC